MKNKYKALLAEIVIAIGVLFTIDFTNLQAIDYLILLFMGITLLFTFMNWREEHVG